MLSLGNGAWRAIRRRGILQNDKVRNIDNARTSQTNFAAWLQDTITTTPADIGVQILCWLFNGPVGITRRKAFGQRWMAVFIGRPGRRIPRCAKCPKPAELLRCGPA